MSATSSRVMSALKILEPSVARERSCAAALAAQARRQRGSARLRETG